MRGLLQRTVQRADAQAPGDHDALASSPTRQPLNGEPQPPPPPPLQAQPPTRAQRGRLRRHLAELRDLHDEQLLDLGGFVLDLYRFGRQRDDVVRGKLAALIASDREMREIERRLDEERAAREVPHRSVGSCARCGTMHTGDSRFCRECGAAVGAAAEAAAVASAGLAATAPPAPDAPSGGAGEAYSPLAPDPPAEHHAPDEGVGGRADVLAPPETEPRDDAPPPPDEAPPLLAPEEPAPAAASEPPPPASPAPASQEPTPLASSPSEWLPPALGAEPRRPDPVPAPPAPAPAPPPADETAASVWHPPPGPPPAAESTAEAEEDPATPAGDEPPPR